MRAAKRGGVGEGGDEPLYRQRMKDNVVQCPGLSFCGFSEYAVAPCLRWRTDAKYLTPSYL